jgi:hypothetical protein
MKQILTTIAILAAPFAMAQNVGIGTTNTTEARLTVEGVGVGNVMGLFKNTTGITLNAGANGQSIGFNYHDGKAIASGTGARLRVNSTSTSGDITLQFYPSANAGAPFGTPKEIFNVTDYTSANSGYWMDILYGNTGRLRMNNKIFTQNNGNLNMLPIGAITFMITGLNNGNNATRTFANAGGNNAELLQSVYSFSCNAANGSLVVVLNLDFISKSYEDIYIVGSPSYQNLGNEVNSCYARFYRNPVGTNDRIQIGLNATDFDGGTQVYGTILVYGTYIGL